VPSVPGLGDVLASNVRAERARRRWRQTDLAERLGWPQSSVSDLESGRRRVGVDDIVPLCRAFDVTLARLLDGAEPDDLRVIGFG
jgi:transcriptional regulator with XRE-family HTH domain